MTKTTAKCATFVRSTAGRELLHLQWRATALHWWMPIRLNSKQIVHDARRPSIQMLMSVNCASPDFFFLRFWPLAYREWNNLVFCCCCQMHTMHKSQQKECRSTELEEQPASQSVRWRLKIYVQWNRHLDYRRYRFDRWVSKWQVSDAMSVDSDFLWRLEALVRGRWWNSCMQGSPFRMDSVWFVLIPTIRGRIATWI